MAFIALIINFIDQMDTTGRLCARNEHVVCCAFIIGTLLFKPKLMISAIACIVTVNCLQSAVKTLNFVGQDMGTQNAPFQREAQAFRVLQTVLSYNYHNRLHEMALRGHAGFDQRRCGTW